VGEGKKKDRKGGGVVASFGFQKEGKMVTMWKSGGKNTPTCVSKGVLYAMNPSLRGGRVDEGKKVTLVGTQENMPQQGVLSGGYNWEEVKRKRRSEQITGRKKGRICIVPTNLCTGKSNGTEVKGLRLWGISQQATKKLKKGKWRQSCGAFKKEKGRKVSGLEKRFKKEKENWDGNSPGRGGRKRRRPVFRPMLGGCQDCQEMISGEWRKNTYSVLEKGMRAGGVG